MVPLTPDSWPLSAPLCLTLHVQFRLLVILTAIYLPEHPPHNLGHSATQALPQNIQGPKGHATWVLCVLLSKHRCAVRGMVLSCLPVTVGEGIQSPLLSVQCLAWCLLALGKA